MGGPNLRGDPKTPRKVGLFLKVKFMDLKLSLPFFFGYIPRRPSKLGVKFQPHIRSGFWCFLGGLKFQTYLEDSGSLVRG